MLQINGLTYRIGGRTILDRASIAVPAGSRAGLVGRNGEGKTTLLRLITGELQPDAGEIRIDGGARVGTVAQEAPDGPESLIDTVLAADRERAALLDEAETATDPARISEVHTRLADIGAHGAPARAAEILAGLGFDEAAQHGPCAALSGGWRMRVALAAVLFARPDILLLDEPTNHLDFEATVWLEAFLGRYAGTVVVVSHDRDLLDRVANRIVHLERGRLTGYTGNFSTFRKTLEQQRAFQEKANEKLMAQRRRMMAFVDRFRAKATKARQAQSRLKMIERLDPIVQIIESAPVAFDFPDPDDLPPPVITAEKASVGYGDGPPVLRNLNLRIDMDDRIALLGRNGNGKSTLIRLLGGRLAAGEGSMRRASKLRIGYFAQHQTEELRPDQSAYQHLQALEPDTQESKVRAHLGRFGFSKEKADVAVAALSGGEKARLLFALMSRGAPHILLLDEPTNHLDIESREALVQALNAYPGAVILVSHDPHLIGLCADRLWLVADGTCRPFDGDVDDYRRHVIDTQRAERRAKRGPEAAVGDARREGRRERARAREASAHLRRAVADAEKKLERLHAEKAALEERLADPELYNGAPDKLQTLLKKQGEMQKRIETAEADWLAAHEALEAAETAVS